MLSRLVLLLTLILAAPLRADPIADTLASGPRVAAFLDALWADASKRGIARATFDQALAGFTPDARVIAATQREPEYVKPVGLYVDAVVSKSRIATGAAKATQWAGVLDATEQKYGADRAVVLALWGIESSFGAGADRWDVIRSLATLAEARYRDPYFRNELLVALKILQDGHIARERLLGSWAGAMGQPQFMPSSFLLYAVDFTADGRRDIWTIVPDVLAAIANTWRAAAGSAPCRGASRSCCRRASTAGRAAARSPTGRSAACGGPTAAPCRARATASCCFRAAPAARPSWSPPIST